MAKDNDSVTVQSFNQSGGITAYEVHQYFDTSPQRHFTDQHCKDFLELVAPFEKEFDEIHLEVFNADNETRNFSAQIQEKISARGVKCSISFNTQMGGMPAQKVSLRIEQRFLFISIYPQDR